MMGSARPKLSLPEACHGIEDNPDIYGKPVRDAEGNIISTSYGYVIDRKRLDELPNDSTVPPAGLVSRF